MKSLGNQSRSVCLGLSLVLIGFVAIPLKSQVVEKKIEADKSSTDEEVVNLPAFSVYEDSGKKGYRSTLIVGANRMVVPIEEMDGSAFVINQQLMRDINPRYLNDVIKFVAGVEQPRTYGPVDLPAVRGRDAGTNLVDGMELGITYYMPVDFVEQYEIIKGAQGVMYGSVSGAGVINRVMKRPLKDFAGEISGQIGTYGYYHGMVDVGGPVPETDGKLTYRVVSSFSEGGGRQKNLMTDLPEQGHMASVQYALPGGGNITVNASLVRRQWNPASEVTGGDPVTGLFDEEYAKDFSVYQSLVTDELSKIAGFTVEKMTGAVSNRLAYRYLYGMHEDDALFPCCINSALPGVERIWARYQKWVDEFNTITYDGVTNFDFGQGISNILTFGATYNKSESTYLQKANYGPNFEYGWFDRYNQPRGRVHLNLASPNMSLFSNTLQDADFWSIYANWRISFWDDRMSLIAGTRRQDYDVLNVNRLPGANVLPAKTGTEDLYRGGLVFKVMQGLNAYAGYGETFRVNTSIAYVPPGSPVTNGSYLPNQTDNTKEVGIHFTSQDQRFSVQAAFYEVAKTGRTSGGQSAFQPIIFMPDNTNTGVELQLMAEPVPGWNLIASLTKAEVRDDDGKRSTDVSEEIANFWTKYTLQDGSAKGLGFAVGMNHWGDKRPSGVPSGTGGSTPNWMIPAVTTYDAAISYRYGKHWDFSLNVHNVTDKLYVVRFSGLLATWFNPGRKATFSASYRW
ncbi:MAG: ligand-gated channel [Chloroflexota bacterium]|nr:MAG: ligand-gated channel [Chloroflexota bacterium]